MLRLLIAEDEKTTREGLRDCIDWQSYGMELVKEVSNGNEAWEFIKEGKIDILITDVVMPVVDGIELVRRIRDAGLDIKIIIISAHWDMPYLKSAFELEAINYILKPIDLKELDNVLKKVSNKCIQEISQKKMMEEYRRKIAESMPLLKERFFMELLAGKMTDAEYIKHRLRFLELPLECDESYAVLSIQVEGLPNAESDSCLENREIALLSIKNLLEENLKKGYSLIREKDGDAMLSVILPCIDMDSCDNLIDMSQQIQQAIWDEMQIKTSIGIGKAVKGIPNVHISFRQSIRALEQKFFLGENQTIHIDDIEKITCKMEFYPGDILDKIIEYMRIGKSDAAGGQVGTLFEEIRAVPKLKLDYVYNICMEIIILLRRQLMEFKISGHDLYEMYSLDQLARIKDIDQLRNCILKVVKDAAEQVSMVLNNTSNNIVNLIKKNVQERYSENLTIQDLGKEFFITPNYICLLFKKETGDTFTNYLTKVRVDKAKEFLKDLKFKMYEVAEKVGYKDPDYFAKVFKKYTGVTPSEYRERLVL